LGATTAKSSQIRPSNSRRYTEVEARTMVFLFIQFSLRDVIIF
jgi:hypothetical protein